MNEDLMSILQNGENETIEFLTNIEDELTIAKIASSFANTNGGSLFVGVRKNGKIAGTEPSESFSLISNAIDNYCSPSLEFESAIYQLDFKIILEIKIIKSTYIHKVIDINKPKIYFRYNNFSLEANTVLRRYLELNKKNVSINTIEELQPILNILKNEAFLSITQLVKKILYKREKVEIQLAQLLHLNKIEIVLVDSGFNYRIKN